MILSEFFRKYPDESACKLAFKQIRDQQGVVCKKCQGQQHYIVMKTSSTFLHPVLVFVCLALFLISCEKDGDPGPQGSQGEQGPKGDQGEKGDPGEKGNLGTANVIYSQWTPFEVGIWNQVTEFGRETQIYPVEDSLVTQEIIDQGLVFVYVRFGGAPQTRPLPFTGYITTSSKNQSLWYRLLSETIEIVFHNLSDNADPGTFGASNSYRYIIVPGGTPLNGRFSHNPQNLSYEEICALFKIPSE